MTPHSPSGRSLSGSAFISIPDIRRITLTLVIRSIALGISSSVSVYEAEIIEREKEVEELEKVMLVNLNNTIHSESLRINALVVSVIEFAPPLFAMIIAITPFLLTKSGVLSKQTAGCWSILLSLGALASVGTYMGKGSNGNELLKGLRMAFLVQYLF